MTVFLSIFVVREMLSLIQPHRFCELSVVETNELVGISDQLQSIRRLF